MRNLASKSAEASANTAVLIENSLKAVQNGIQIADQTAAALGGVVTGAEEVMVSIGAIAEASDRQSQAIAQITIGIDQISAVVQTNTATAEESAAASEELSSQAQQLKNLIGRFRLSGQPAASAAPMAMDMGSDDDFEYELMMNSGKY